MDTKEILDFLHEIEKLKKELRHSWLSNGRQESVAEHTWRVVMMVLLMADKLDTKIDLTKSLKMAVIHDISEVFVGDMPAQNMSREEHKTREEKAMLDFKNKYDSKIINEIYNLWVEFEKSESLEAKFVKALDKLEVRIQHNEADMKTWDDIEFPRSQFVADKPCEHDAFLKEINDLVKKDSREKIIKESDKKIADILARADKMK